MIALDSVLASLLARDSGEPGGGGYSFLAVGNERSANFGNGIHIDGLELNHQWEKSADFEGRVNAYIDEHLLRTFRYFSPLASLWEVQIAGYFSVECAPFLSCFCSCNSYTGNEWAAAWCGSCAKCLFVFILLSAWLPRQSVVDIFGGMDLLGVYSPTQHLDKLLGSSHCGSKPLDCVGTPEETSASLSCAAARYDVLPWVLRLSQYAWRHGDMRRLVSDFGEASASAPPWFSAHAMHARVAEVLLPLIPETCAEASSNSKGREPETMDVPGECWDVCE